MGEPDKPRFDGTFLMLMFTLAMMGFLFWATDARLDDIAKRLDAIERSGAG